MKIYLKKLIWFLLLVFEFSHLNHNNTTSSYSQYKYTSERYYIALEETDHAKRGFQTLLHSFLENLQKNLSSSILLNAAVNRTNVVETDNRHHKLEELSSFFQYSSEQAASLANSVELSFEITKNESYELLMKFGQIRSTQSSIPNEMKALRKLLEEYFVEMESFHTFFSSIVDDSSEYIGRVLRSVRDIFMQYADIQKDTFRRFKATERCYHTYMDFLQQWSANIFICATAIDLNIAYDVYATTETVTKQIMKQLDFHMQRLHNCLTSSDRRIRCQFLRNPEYDFSKLFNKLDELQQYFDIKIKRGRVNRDRKRRSDINKRYESIKIKPEIEIDPEHNFTIGIENKCIPFDFPYKQMSTNLKACFNSLS